MTDLLLTGQNKFLRFEEINLDDLYVGESNVRTENVKVDLEILKEHIYVNGLLESIVVFAVDDLSEDHDLYASRKGRKGKYEILAGQRRFTAFKELDNEHPGEGFDRIPCHVRTPPEDGFDAKAISIGENLTQLPMTLADSIDACDTLFKKYNDPKIVARKHGISVYLVNKYVKFARLAPSIQNNLGKIHKSPKTAMNLALEATDAIDCDNNDPESVNKALNLAIRLGEKKKESKDDYNRLKQAAEENPKASLEDMEKESNKVRNPKIYKVRLEFNIANDLDSLAESHGIDPEDEAAVIIKEELPIRVSQNK